MSHPIDDNAARPERGRAGFLKTAFITVLIVLVGVALVWFIFKTEPTATRGGAARETAMLVDVQTVRRGQYSPTVQVMGEVMPAREVTLNARVSGRVVQQAEAFTPGRLVASGQELMRVEPADYQIALEQRRSELQKALADLELEQGQQAVARQEFELLGEDIPVENEALILRKPQLQQARATVAAARAAVRQAELNLARTHIQSPFPAQVLAREVTLGSEISTGEALGRLVATDEYWVEATVPLSQLRWLTFRDESQPATAVTLYQDSWEDGQQRDGRLQQLVGELDSNARMARVLIAVEDPLGLDEAQGSPGLILGSILKVKIEGRPLENVVRLDRDLIRRNNTVWVMEDRTLAVRKVDVAFMDENFAYIRDGLADGDQVITNDLASVVDGAKLRLEGEQP